MTLLRADRIVGLALIARNALVSKPEHLAMSGDGDVQLTATTDAGPLTLATGSGFDVEPLMRDLPGLLGGLAAAESPHLYLHRGVDPDHDTPVWQVTDQMPEKWPGWSSK
jgi:hypothetical protein